MSRYRSVHMLLKKDSFASDSTSFLSQQPQGSRVISVQKNISTKLTDYLYENNVSSSRRTSFSFASILEKNSQEKSSVCMDKKDPFLKAQLRCLADRSNKPPPQKKIGKLYDQLNMQANEDTYTTTFKFQREKSSRVQDKSLRQYLNNRTAK